MAGAARDELSAADAGRRAVEAVWRIESARIVGALARYTGDFPLAEDVASEALAEALDSGEIKGAGLDVLNDEPPEDSPLLDREDVLLSPHAGWYSESAREDLCREVGGDVARVLAGEDPENPVTGEW